MARKQAQGGSEEEGRRPRIYAQSRERTSAQEAQRRARSPQAREFITRATSPSRTPLVAELELNLGQEVLPLWEATEQWLGRPDALAPFWAFAWAGGQALARYVMDHAALVRERGVLDFGTGSGIVGIAAARAGAARVLSVDIDPLAVTACEMNAELNGVVLEARCQDVVGTELGEHDVVLAGDMFYERSPSARFWAWLSGLAKGGKLVLLGDPGRNYLPEGLVPLASYPVATTRDLEGRDAWNARVWQIPA